MSAPTQDRANGHSAQVPDETKSTAPAVDGPSESADSQQVAAEAQRPNTQAAEAPAAKDNAGNHEPPTNGTGTADDGAHAGEKPAKWNPAEESGQPSGKMQERASGMKDKITDKKQKIKDKAKPAGGFDKTPLPDAPPGYTVKFTFKRATNLPIADINTSAADPYIVSTIMANVPRRHKEDPDLAHRTRTIHNTKEPEWNEEWIVANLPQSGFVIKSRLYDEDSSDHDDRLGNVTILVPPLNSEWRGFGPEGRWYDVKKRSGSKRAYILKAAVTCLHSGVSMTPRLQLGIQVLGPSDPPYSQIYTVGPTCWRKHFSPMIGRLAGVKVNRDEEHDADASTHPEEKQTKKYDFQATEMQLAGPVPPEMYHRFVEFRPFVALMFSSRGVRGTILNKALHKQHRRVYNFDKTTEYGSFEPCSTGASLQFLKLAHFDEGGRIFTYVLTLDGLLRFTETGTEFGIDLLSKHTMHSDVATYIACSGEFFIRRLKHADASDDPNPPEPTHPDQDLPDGPPHSPPPRDPRHYQLVIDNDSGTYRPDKSILPQLKKLLSKNFPDLGIVAMHWEDEQLKKLKEKQVSIKRKEGRRVRMVQHRSHSSSSLSSAESDLDDMEALGDENDTRFMSTRGKAYDILEHPEKLKHMIVGGQSSGAQGESSKAAAA